MGCERLFFEPEPANSPVENFKTLWTTFDERYAPFEQRNIDWLQIFEVYRPRVDERINDNELYSIMTGMLAVLDDAHVTLTAPFRPVWNSNRISRLGIGDEFFSIDKIKKNFLSSFFVADPFIIGNIVVNGHLQLGYLYIQSFETRESGDVGLPITLTGSSIVGIILDLRHNSGGDFRNGLRAASKFAGEKRVAFSTQTKRGPEPNDFSPKVDWYIEPDKNFIFHGPVVVLTDRFTVSAAERTVLALRTLPTVTTMGDTTSGALGEKIGQELPNGWKYSLTPQVVFDADGISYEGRGIPPDIYVRPTQVTDRVLVRAVEFLTADARNN